MNARSLLPAHRGIPDLQVVAGVDYRDRYRGAMLGVGIGDALGRPAESRSPDQLRDRYGTITDFIPWGGWRGGPRGTFTDDSELTLALAESLIERTLMDPIDFGHRCAAWLPVGRGKGRATVEACDRLSRGVPWDEAGTASAGNGAAMRAGPIGLLHPLDIDALRIDAALSAVVTHADPTAVISAIALAYLVAELVHTPQGHLDVAGLLQCLGGVLEDLADPPLLERKAGGREVRLVHRLLEMGDRLDQEPAELFAYTYNGALVTESLPAALWCFLRSPDDPELTLITAVNQGYDADTVGAMAGALSGSYNGAVRWPKGWLDELEYRDGFLGCADDLLDLARLPARSRPQARLPEVAAIDEFTGPFGFLTNSARTPIEVDGLRYPTVLHAYCSRRVTEPHVAEDIRLLPTPAGVVERRRMADVGASSQGRSVEDMNLLLSIKFALGSSAAKQLVATGRARLRNSVWWEDRFWGIHEGVGENRLGGVLETLRARLAPLSPEAADPRAYLSRLLRQPDTQTHQIIHDRDRVLADYGRLFHPDNLERLTAADFKGFLLYENNRHWWGIHRQQAILTSDMPRLRRVLAVLLDDSRPLKERLDWIEPRSGPKPQPGLGRAVITPILHVVYPERYGVWNSIAQGAMTRLGLWPEFPWGSTFGGQYLLVNESLRQWGTKLGIDLWTLDALWWRVERDHEPEKHTVEGSDSTSTGSPTPRSPKGTAARFTCRVCGTSKAVRLRSNSDPDACVDCVE